VVRQPVCSGIVGASGEVRELAFVSEVPSRRTSVWTIQARNSGVLYIRLVFGKAPLNAVALS
jgi:hypothetical protein